MSFTIGYSRRQKIFLLRVMSEGVRGRPESPHSQRVIYLKYKNNVVYYKFKAVNKMYGWIISFLSDSAQNTTENVEHKDEYCALSWSPYDRISIKKAESFEELCTSSSIVRKSELETDWPGSERTMHIVLDWLNTHKDIWELSPSKQKIIDNK